MRPGAVQRWRAVMQIALDRAFRATILVLAGVVAAPLAHLAIDAIGDVVLAHDAFDAIAHRSRGVALAAIAAVVLTIVLRLIWNALAEAGGERRDRRALLQRAAVSWPTLALAVLPLTYAGVIAMEAFDVVSAGGRIDDLVDLVGGSPLLALACVAAASAVTTLAIRVLHAAATAAHRCLVSVIVALFERVPRNRALRAVRRRGPVSAARAASACARIRGLRAPPRFLGPSVHSHSR